MSNHSLPIKLPYGENTMAYCCYDTPKTLVVFIHGFNGSAVETWNDFPVFIQKHPKFRQADVVFYGYESLKLQAGNLKLHFFDFLNAITKPYSNRIPFPARNLPKAFAYDKVIIVAHSLGAVVTRLAFLHAYEKKCKWLNKCKPILYAPAHWGSLIPENFKECFQGVFSIFRGFAVTRYPIIADLTSGSIVLNDLQEKSRKLCESRNLGFLRAHVIWAEREIVVVNNPFCNDYPVDQIKDTVHTSVCKPQSVDDKSFQILVSQL